MPSEVAQRSPGQYASERHRAGLRSYRRRIRRPLLLVTVPAVVGVTALAAWLNTTWWWWSAGLVTGGMTALFVFAWDDPPEFVAKWGRGAAGERRTAKVLRHFERQGWRIEHDLQKGGWNVDHVLEAPQGASCWSPRTWLESSVSSMAC